ncbi:condensin-2 complex subunit G2, putative [Hepatocystis sp. ex Piliocolobus tephrosceles]|nr:condensin-2 complex subunit G2, putative [Hepatocystis sp. ex Piliocolobus tephrosceles]
MLPHIFFLFLFFSFLICIYTLRDADVNNLIFKTYDPVIWKNLMSPNWKIRLNATCLYHDIFPIVDPGIKSTNYEEEMDKACDSLFDLAKDNNSSVLRATAKCICYKHLKDKNIDSVYFYLST